MLKVFKFGGASLRHGNAIRQVVQIVKQFPGEKLLVVVSAMGKTTNALERVVSSFLAGQHIQAEFQSLRFYHEEVMRDLFPPSHPVFDKVGAVWKDVLMKLRKEIPADQLYDQIVSAGEIVSSLIASDFFMESGLPVAWIDARKFIHTDKTYREGKVDWTLSGRDISTLAPVLQEKIILTQGFIGSDPGGLTTTLGREGSDYSAAIFASCLPAESVTIWKDVPGVMNADPKRLPEATVFDELPFREAAEMTYYGASVIHPKTIKPLANKNIPLFVKNFDDPSLPGTIIHETRVGHLPPLIVFKDNQCLVSCRVMDYTFINEQQLSFIFSTLSEFNIKINVMQNSAISFSFCIDFREDKTMKLIEELARHFEVYYNTGLTLITIKNYDAVTSEFYRKKQGLLLEQSSRSTLQVLVKN
jgi:aspartate kinase